MITRFVDVNGASTRCMVAGNAGAPALLLVHGVSLTSEIWLRNIDVLANSFHVVAVDMLGHGFTRPAIGREDVTIPDKVEHLAAVAAFFGWKQYALAGSSYGGLICANLYIKRPESVTKLVIAGSGSSFNTEDQMQDFVDRIYANYKPTLTTSSPEVWRKRLESTFFDPKTIPPELPPILSLCYAQPWAERCWESTIATMRDRNAFRRFRILERLEAVTVETLIVWGLNDKGGIYESATAAVKRMPKAKMVAFDCCGHMPMMEHADRFNQEVAKFLGDR